MAIQTVISVDDSLYLHWQTQLLLYSMQKVNQPGPLIRVIATSDFQKTRPLIGAVSSFISKPFSPHPITKDHYPPYNKPASLREWSLATPDTGETLLIIDPDCVFLRPVEVEVEPGHPIAEDMFFMSPLENLAKGVIKRHCRKNTKLIQPVGVPLLIRKCDLRLIAPRWIQLTEEMREDKQTLEEIPWIVEMWAYAIAAAEVGITHQMQNNQQFPTEDIISRPLIHYSYGTESKDGKWKWDKRTYSAFSKPSKSPLNIPKAGKIMHDLLVEAANYYQHAIIS